MKIKNDRIYRMYARNEDGTRNHRGLLEVRVSNGQLNVGYALCRKTDRFDKKFANELCATRLNHPRYSAAINSEQEIDQVQERLPQCIRQRLRAFLNRVEIE